jgi:hypothetical protein
LLLEFSRSFFFSLWCAVCTKIVPATTRTIDFGVSNIHPTPPQRTGRHPLKHHRGWFALDEFFV